MEYGPLADLYDLLNETGTDYGEQVELIQAALLRWGVGRAGRLLDLACATGLHAHPLAAAGHEVVAVDTSLPLLTRARAKPAPGAGPRFLCQDMRALGLHDAAFDAAYCLNHTLNYMVANADLSALLSEVHRLLRTGGLFIFDCISYLNPTDWQGRWTDTCRTPSGKVRMVHRYATDWLQQVCVDRHTYEVEHQGRRAVHQGTDRLRVIWVQDVLLHADRSGLRSLHLCGKWRLDTPVGETGPVIVVRKVEA